MLGIGVTGWLLATLWPKPDRVAAGAPLSADQPEILAPFPEVSVTVLVIGVDADRLGAAFNQAAPRGPANADALLLLRIAHQEPLQVLQIPTKLGFQLPGEKNSGSLAQLWRRGRVSLLSDAIRDIVGLQQGDPKRYVVIPRAALRHLPDPNAVFQRRQRQNILVESLIEQVKDPSGIAVIPGLVNQLNTEVETNLSRTEQLSLAAAIIASPAPARISRLPLADPVGEQTLRQIEAGASFPLWPQL